MKRSARFDSSPVLVNIANRSLTMVGGLALIAVVTIKLSPVMQGFYYTFYSLTILRFFAELGLTVAVVQTIAHLSAKNEYSEKIDANTRFFINWFKFAAALLTIFLLPAIFIFRLGIESVGDPWSRVIGPWILLAIATGLSVVQYGLTSIVEGHGRLINVSQIRLAVSATNLFGCALFLLLNFELWAISIAALLSALVGLILCHREKDVLCPAKSNSVDINWRSEIWPFQWRLAVSWASSFFIFYFITPVVMRWHGPIPAGQVGLSLQLFQTMSSVAVIVISTNSAIFGKHIALMEFDQLGKNFRTGSLRSLMILATMLACFWVGYASLDLFGLAYLRARLVSIESLGALTVGTFGTHLFFLYNYYLRSYKDDGLWWIALINSIATVILCFFFVPRYGVDAAVLIFTFNSVVFWGVAASILVKYRTKSLQAKYLSLFQRSV